MIDGNTQVLGLIGNPVTHTLSPTIHNTIAEYMGMNLIYVPFPVSNGLDDAVRGAFNLQIGGLNVTVPYKTQVMHSLVEIDDEASLIGAVNTLVRTECGYKGYNTDLPGLYQALISEGILLSGNKVVIIGAGGAARAAAFLCALKGVKELIIANRTVEHAQNIVKELQDKLKYSNATAYSIENVGELPGSDYIALQATKVGLSPDFEQSPVLEESFFKKLSVVYDFIYRPCETQFMKLARSYGVPSYHGLKMLLYQGVYSFELWNRTQVPIDVIEKTYDVLMRNLEGNE